MLFEMTVFTNALIISIKLSPPPNINLNRMVSNENWPYQYKTKSALQKRKKKEISNDMRTDWSDQKQQLIESCYLD